MNNFFETYAPLLILLPWVIFFAICALYLISMILYCFFSIISNTVNYIKKYFKTLKNKNDKN